MKLLLSAVVVLFSTAPVHAQAGETGVSHPDSATITVESDEATPKLTPRATPRAKPSAAIPYTAPAAATLPASNPTSQSPASRLDARPAPLPADPDANIVTTNAPLDTVGDDSTYRPYTPAALHSRPTEADPDAQIVTDVPLRAGEMPEGTLLKVRINSALSTQTSLRGAPFTATVEEDVQREGRTIIPAGSQLAGTVTEVHGGHRISGRAAIHLEPRRVTLPDGTFYVVHAQVTDSGEENSVRVDGEGTIVRRDHAAETLAIMGGTTGAAAVAGAMIGGGVGAAVGAGIGAGAGTILWLRQDRQAALPKDTALIFSLTTPMMLTPLKPLASTDPAEQ